MNLKLCFMIVEMFLPFNHISKLSHYMMAVQTDADIFLPCDYRNKPSTVFHGCADVLHNAASRNKVSVVDAELVT